jgi:hypothetical protein
MIRSTRSKLAFAGVLTTLVVATAGVAEAGPERHATTVTVAANPAALAIGTGTCRGAALTVSMTNGGKEAVYADATIAAPAALHLNRTMISSYLPVGYTRSAAVAVSARTGTPAGTYPITVTSDSGRVVVPVTVTPTVADPGGNLARTADTVTASSSHVSYPVCGAVDGDADSTHWGTTTGWNDGTSKSWPDWFEVTFASPTTVGRVGLQTLDSAKYPAARYGLRDWDVQLLVDGAWQTVGQVRGNTVGLVNTSFTPRQAGAVRLSMSASNGANDYSRIVELEIYAA